MVRGKRLVEDGVMAKCEKCGRALTPENTAIMDDACGNCWEDFCSMTWWQMVGGKKLATWDEFCAKGR